MHTCSVKPVAAVFSRAAELRLCVATTKDGASVPNNVCKPQRWNVMFSEAGATASFHPLTPAAADALEVYAVTDGTATAFTAVCSFGVLLKGSATKVST